VTATADSRWRSHTTMTTWLIPAHFCLIQLTWLWIFFLTPTSTCQFLCHMTWGAISLDTGLPELYSNLNY
jgi:hypothetical protein